MDRELLFAKKIEELKELAAGQGGMVTTAQVEQMFEELKLEKSGMDLVYDYLKTKKIGVDTKIDPDDYLSNDEVDYLNTYMDSLLELPSYTDGEKQAIYMSAMAGDTAGKSRLIELMLPNVVDIAKLYASQGMFIDDLIGEGNVALSMGVEMLGALEAPEEVPGMLTGMIMDAMEDALGEEADSKKIDEKLVEKVNKVADEAGELAEALGRKVTVDEIVAEGKLSRKAVMDAIRLSGRKIDDIEIKEES
ncbi:MAG: hypothetical protein K6G69_07840 [Lachnospiraceae bacterium]|nr:hypothetical protein [Lachnospiraceae bacterium]